MSYLLKCPTFSSLPPFLPLSRCIMCKNASPLPLRHFVVPQNLARPTTQKFYPSLPPYCEIFHDVIWHKKFSKKSLKETHTRTKNRTINRERSSPQIASETTALLATQWLRSRFALLTRLRTLYGSRPCSRICHERNTGLKFAEEPIDVRSC